MVRTDYNGGRLAGLILIVLGAAFLFGGLLNVTFWLIGRILWPLALLLVGAACLERQYHHYRWTGRFPFPWPLFLIAGGVAGLLKTFGIVTFGLFSWPLLLILFGLWMLINRR